MADEAPNGYTFGREKFAELLLRKYFPERTDRESGVLLAYLVAHADEFDEVTFSVRIGKGLEPNPEHLPGVQANTRFSTRKRIDMLARRGELYTIVECKERVTPASLGQITTYKHLFLEEHPDAIDPALVVIGRYSDEDTIRALQANGVTVYLYPPDDTPRADATVGV